MDNRAVDHLPMNDVDGPYDNGPCGDGRLARPAEAKQGGTHPTPNPLSFRRGAKRQAGICCPRQREALGIKKVTPPHIPTHNQNQNQIHFDERLESDSPLHPLTIQIPKNKGGR
jgi:hypothetical protein